VEPGKYSKDAWEKLKEAPVENLEALVEAAPYPLQGKTLATKVGPFGFQTVSS